MYFLGTKLRLGRHCEHSEAISHTLRLLRYARNDTPFKSKILTPGNDGGTLIEILIAIFILAIIFASYGSTFLIGKYTVRRTEVEKEAQNAARETLEELSNYVAYEDSNAPTNANLVPGLNLPDDQVGETKWALQDGSSHTINFPVGHPLKTIDSRIADSIKRSYKVTDTPEGGKQVEVTVEWKEKRMPGQE